MSRYFPLFVDLEGKKIMVYGAGAIAGRRIGSLLDFGCMITVTAPEISEKVRKLAEQEADRLRLIEEPYVPGGIPEDTYLVLAATNDREVNRAIRQECRDKQILVNVSSEKELCDFYFPGLAVKEDVVVGVTAGGSDHRLAKELTEKVKKNLFES